MTVFEWMQQASKEQLILFLYINSKEISSKRKITKFLDEPMADEMIKTVEEFAGGN